MPVFHKVVLGSMVSRQHHVFGSGQFGMPRSGRRHRHTHEGLDIVTKPGQTILSPIAGEIVREALPYGKLSPYTGIAIRGDGEWQGYEVKVFYVAGTIEMGM